MESSSATNSIEFSSASVVKSCRNPNPSPQMGEKDLYNRILKETENIGIHLKSLRIPSSNNFPCTLTNDRSFIEPELSTLTDRKSKILRGMIENLLKLNDNCPDNKTELDLQVKDNLSKTIADVMSWRQNGPKLEELKEESECLERVLSDLAEINVGADEALCQANFENDTECLSQLSIIIGNLKKDLDLVLSELYPDKKDDLKSILSELERTLKNEEKWCELEPNAALNILINAGIVEANPSQNGTYRLMKA